MSQAFEHLVRTRQERGGGFLLLIDPDRTPEDKLLRLAESAHESGVDALLVGTSFMLNNRAAGNTVPRFCAAIDRVCRRRAVHVARFKS